MTTGDDHSDLTRGSFLLPALARGRLDEIIKCYQTGKPEAAAEQEKLIITLGDHACIAIRRAIDSGKYGGIAPQLEALEKRAQEKAEEYREKRRQSGAKAKPLSEQELPLPKCMAAIKPDLPITINVTKFTVISRKAGVIATCFLN